MLTRILPLALAFFLAACPQGPTPEADVDRPDADIDRPDTDVMAPPDVEGCKVLCDDDNPCTDEHCGEDGCVYTLNTATCDDGDPCTRGDRCVTGVCRGEALTCDDGNPCTRDACIEGACEHTPHDGACDDQNACTVADRCHDGACVGTPRECPGGPCAVSVCDPASGCQVEALDGPCDDGDACTREDNCVDGRCVGTLALCDDGNPCTDDYCDPSVGCVHRPNRATCDDGDACTTGDRCLEGQCLPGPATTCCTHDEDCGPAPACQRRECASGTCVVRPLCDDGDACTLDQCAEDQQCDFVPWTSLAAEGAQRLDDFESSPHAWRFTSDNPEVGWATSTAWSASGTTSLYLGNPTTQTYNHGRVLATALRPLLVPPGRVTLSLTLNADLGDPGSCLYDALELALIAPDGARAVLAKVCSSTSGPMRVAVDAQPGAYDLELRFDTRDGLDNNHAGIFIDDLSLDVQHSCP